MFKVEFWLSVIFERRGLVFFVEQRDIDDPGIDDLINEEPSPISGTRRARHVGGRRRDTHTAKCEHTVKHHCFIDIDRSPHVSSSANDSFKKFTGACSRLPHHSHFSHGRAAGRRFVREEVRIWCQSRGLESLCLPICTTGFVL